MTEIRVVPGNIVEAQVDGIVVNLFEGVTRPGGATGAVDRALGGEISRLIDKGYFKGKLNETFLIPTSGRIPADHVLVVGLGKSSEFDLDRVRQVSATAAKTLRRVGCKRIATIVHGAGIGGLDPAEAARALAEGTFMGLYRFDKYLTSREENTAGDLEEVLVVEFDAAKIPVLTEGVERGRIVAEAVNFARDLVNEPANVLTPTEMANRAREMAARYGLEFEVLDREQMESLGMGAFLAVAAGSAQPPKLIVLKYWGTDRSEPPIAFIGKGITFDTGGISIKPAQGMEEMKTDMSGAAAVLGAMQAVARLKPKINVIGLAGCTENMPSGTATRPGDIVRAMNGTTIEIINTDAEGRLVLADCVCYARKLGARAIVDLATLTGACVVALGKVASGAFTTSPEFLSKVRAAADAAGEKIWELPLFEEYRQQLKSDCADIKNVGGREAGAITAAYFIRTFAEDTPWVHLDIAGTARADKEQPYIPKGGTGVGVRTLVELVLREAGQS
jgi:leucyl aminopeptidase